MQLTPTEYDVLKLLVTPAGKVLTHRHILSQIWGAAYLEQPHILRVTISNLRHKLEPEPEHVRATAANFAAEYERPESNH